MGRKNTNSGIELRHAQNTNRHIEDIQKALAHSSSSKGTPCSYSTFFFHVKSALVPTRRCVASRFENRWTSRSQASTFSNESGSVTSKANMMASADLER